MGFRYLEELNNRKSVLRRMGYIEGDDVITMKGKVVGAGSRLPITYHSISLTIRNM